MTTMDKLCILTYNSTGLSSFKCQYITELLDKLNVNILLLQETWLVQGNLDRLGSIHPNYAAYGISGVDDSSILQGRPYGGLGFLWNHRLSPYIKRIPTGCKRLCAISLQCSNMKMLLINLYMPVDNMSKSHVTDEFLSVCDAMEIMLNKYFDHQVLLGGDLNIDFSRNNAHDLYFKSLLERVSLTSCWDMPISTPDYTYSSPHCDSTSQIDHFCFQQNLVQRQNINVQYFLARNGGSVPPPLNRI